MATIKTRWWNVGVVVFWFALLGLPAAGHWMPRSGETLAENRPLAPAAAMPDSLASALAWPAAVQAWLHDHFGWRRELLVANNRFHHRVFGSFTSGSLVSGKDGYVFHGTEGLAHHNALRALCGADAVPMPKVRAQMRRMIDVARTGVADSYLLVVPDKARLNPEKRPQWLQDECAPFAPPLDALAAALSGDPDMAGRWFYPIDRMRAADRVRAVYPPWNLHWDYQGALPVADWLARERWSLPRRFDLPSTEQRLPFDLPQFAPGLGHWHQARVPLYEGTGVLVCHNAPECFPEFPAEAATLFQVARYRSAWQLPVEQRRPRLVILGDSFGEAIADPLAPYFAEVWYLSMNQLARLTPEQKRRLRHVAVDLFRPDVLLQVYSERTVLYGHERYLPRIADFLNAVPPP